MTISTMTLSDTRFGAQRSQLGFRLQVPQPLGERTVMKDVTFSVGRTGAVTPVGEVEAVEEVIGDVTVTSVTLHNRDIVEGLDLKIGKYRQGSRSLE